MTQTRSQARAMTYMEPPIIRMTASHPVRFTAKGAVMARRLMIPTDEELHFYATSIPGVTTYHFCTHAGKEFRVPANIVPEVRYVDME